jgi:hypothetical protein
VAQLKCAIGCGKIASWELHAHEGAVAECEQGDKVEGERKKKTHY